MSKPKGKWPKTPGGRQVMQGRTLARASRSAKAHGKPMDAGARATRLSLGRGAAENLIQGTIKTNRAKRNK